jgi:poly-gamma-glutamate capsule biosynthesis protein CapA/YwtB (metallophosphatase superfamily)
MANWTFGAVGDVFVNRPDPGNAFRGCDKLLQKLDLVFGNCEGAYADSPHFAPSAGWRVVAPLACGGGLGEAGFHVMALANNHILDAGHEGLFDTRKLLESQGILAIGAGADLNQALAPAIVERQGQRIGFLSYASVYQAGYEARKGTPGLAPLRVHSHYYIPDWDAYGKVEPGVPPEVRTIPFPEDLERMGTAIAELRSKTDIVIVSHHWGRAGRPAILTGYERIVGRAAIDAGADIVLGHHHHFLRGIEIYRDRPIYYGLGHFVFDLPGLGEALTPLEISKLHEMGEYAIFPRAGYPLSPFHSDARMTMVATCDFDGPELRSVGFVPCLLNGENHAIPLSPGCAQAREVLDYMRRITAEATLPTRYAEADPRLTQFAQIQVLF